MKHVADRFAVARLYLVCGAVSAELLDAAIQGGVNIVQLRCKDAAEDQILAVSRTASAVCQRHGVPFVLNDRPDLVQAAGADGAHIGQDDMDANEARRLVGSERLLGLSTHTPEQIDAAEDLPLDYIGVGPVHSTPTKPGRPPVGLELVRYAAEHAALPYFAIGGIGLSNVDDVLAAGARRIAVVRAVTQSPDPGGTARALQRALVGRQAQREARVGAT